MGFRRGHTADEVRCLEVLRNLVVGKVSVFEHNLSHTGPRILTSYAESYVNASGSRGDKPLSNNLKSIRHFIKASNILDNIVFGAHRSDHHIRFLQTIQLLFTHWQLNLSVRSQARGFGFSQHMVYNHPSKVPMFLDRKWTVNVEYFLHIVNFFKYHMKTETENTLYPLFRELKQSERPSAWDCQLVQVQGVKKLDSNWKGSYGNVMPRS